METDVVPEAIALPARVDLGVEVGGSVQGAVSAHVPTADRDVISAPGPVAADRVDRVDRVDPAAVAVDSVGIRPKPAMAVDRDGPGTAVGRIAERLRSPSSPSTSTSVRIPPAFPHSHGRSNWAEGPIRCSRSPAWSSRSRTATRSPSAP